MKKFRVWPVVMAGVLTAGMSGCVTLPWQKTAAPAEEPQLRSHGDWGVWVSMPSERKPDDALRQRLLEKARAQLSARLTQASRAPVDAWLRDLPPFMHRLLEKMNWREVEVRAPVYAVQFAWSAEQKVLDGQVELDWAKLVKQLRARRAALDAQLRCYRRVPDRVSHLKQLQALIPALPLLLERLQLRTLQWRFDPDSRVDKADRLARMLLERVHTLAMQLHVEVDTEVEKHRAFERLLRAQLAREGFSLRAKPADLRVLYAVTRRLERQGGHVRVLYETDLELTDGDGVPFAQYRLDASGEGHSEKLAEVEAMATLGRSIVDKLLDYLLRAYRLPQPCRDREKEPE